MPDATYMTAARTAAHAEWTRVVRRHRWRVSLWRLSAAAMVLVAVGAFWLAGRRVPPPEPGSEVATVRTVVGEVVLTRPGSPGSPLTASGARLRVGDRIDTTVSGRLALAMAGGLSIRFDRATAAVLRGPDRLYVRRGAVYVDTGRGRDGHVRVETEWGRIDHAGTQFEVRVHDDALVVSVREGEITVEREGGRWTSRAGERLRMRANRPVERTAMSAFAPAWEWTTELAEPFALEGSSLPEFLDWASRELGMRWVYADARMRASAGRIVLHGSIAGLTPQEALAAVLPTCGLTSSQDNGRIIVSARTGQ
jgi:ferric-dicitrate binding protein FerR (iron transport regulator)